MDNTVQRYVQHFNTYRLNENYANPCTEVTRTIESNSSVIKDTPFGHVPKQTFKPIKTLESPYWRFEEYDDGSFHIRQHELARTPYAERIIKFGPLSATIRELFAMGFHLQIEGWITRKKQKLHLVRDNEKYKVAAILTSQITTKDDLCSWVPQAGQENQVSTTKREDPIEMDPFDVLLRKYPVKRKPIQFIGNQTLPEYVNQQLREQRRLLNV